MHTWVIEHEEELTAIARTVLDTLTEVTDHAYVLALKGDLGAGKTAFTKTLARELGIHEHITSPTFVIMKSYPVTNHSSIRTLTHIDAYRLEEERELSVLGFTDLLRDPTRLICIEWPERVLGLMPPHSHTLSLVIGQNGERIITYGE